MSELKPIIEEHEKQPKQSFREDCLFICLLIFFCFLSILYFSRYVYFYSPQRSLLRHIERTGGLVVYFKSHREITWIDDLLGRQNNSDSVRRSNKNLKMVIIEPGSINSHQLKSLAYLKSLKSLSLKQSHFSDLKPLKSLTELVGLGLSDNEISNLSSLMDMKNLRVLGLQRNNISDLRPLMYLHQLKTLDLTGNIISNLSPLAGLSMLRTLEVSDNTGLTIAEINKLQKTLPNCRILHNATK